MNAYWYHAIKVSKLGMQRVWMAVLLMAVILGGLGNPVALQTARAQDAADPLPAPEATQVGSKLYLPGVWLNADPGTQPVAPPSAQELIYKALQDGKIDYHTSLLYRAYALYMDPRLPEELRSQPGEDLSLYPEIEAAWTSMPADLQAQLNGFRVRPNDPASAITGPWTLPAGVAARTAQAPGAPEAAVTVVCDHKTKWSSITSATLPVRVHAQCFEGPLDETLTAPHLQLTLQTLESLWQPMVDYMGVSPLDDAWATDDGGDERIDFYLLLDNESFTRGGNKIGFRDDEGGFARPLDPRKGKTASGFVVLRRSPLLEGTQDGVAFRKLVAHEFFHLLQFARNEELLYRNGVEYWFTEASAVWAGWNFVPQERQKDHYRFTRFQESPLSLNATGPSGSDALKHTYTAYIWPFFMHQQVNSFTISQAWKDFANVNTWEAADEVLNKLVNFDRNFPLFALRNLNNSIRFGNAYDGHYVHFDPAFPDTEVPPHYHGGGLVMPGDSKAELFKLPALRAHYYHYTVEPGVMQLEVKLSNVAPETHFSADMVAKVRGKGWKVLKLGLNGALRFCPDNPDNDIEEFYLVLSNTNPLKDNQTNGVFSIRDLEAPCTCQDFSQISGFTGTMTLGYNKSAEDTSHFFSLNHTAAVSFTLQVNSQGPNGISFIGPLSGQASLNDTHIEKDVPPDTETLVLSGPPMNGGTPGELSRAYLNINLADCTYNLGMTPILALQTDGGPAVPQPVGSVRSADRPFSLDQLTGEADFPAHSTLWGQANEGDAYFPQGYGRFMFLFNVVSESGGGAAHFTWTLAPVFKP